MTKRKQEKEEVENAAPDNSHFDIMSEISQDIPQKFTHPKDHPDEIARREDKRKRR